MSIILQDQLTLSTKTKEQVEKNTQDIAKNTQDIEDLEEKIAVVYKFKGSVDTYAELPTEDNQTGDVWDVKEDDMNYAWTADGEWDQLGPTVDLSGYVPTSRTINNKTLESDITLEPSDIGAQETLVSGTNIKTINGNSVLGDGNLELTQYLGFPSNWPTTNTTTTKQFCDVVAADTDAIEGKMYLGEVRWSDLSTINLVNAEVTVSIMKGNTASNKVIVLKMTSGNQSPYQWQYTYWNNGSNVSGWIGFQPKLTPGTGIAINNNTISADLMVGSDGTIAGSAGMVPAPAKADNTKFLRGDGNWAEVQTDIALTDIAEAGNGIAFTGGTPVTVQNFTVEGSPTITDGVASNFSKYNYLKANYHFDASDKPWKFSFKFTPTHVSGHDSIIGGEWNTLNESFMLIRLVSGKMLIMMTDLSNPSTNFINNTGTYSFTNNKTYYGEVGYDGTKYYSKYKQSGSDTWTPDMNITSSSLLNDGYFVIGTLLYSSSGSGGEYFQGSIDLNEFSVEIDNEVVWTPYTETPASKTTISATTMTGATGVVAGTTGMVPAPSATDNVKFLKGDGTWSEVKQLEAYQSLTAAQRTILLNNGTYDGKAVTPGTIFTQYDGTFQKFTKKQIIDETEFVDSGDTIPDGISYYVTKIDKNGTDFYMAIPIDNGCYGYTLTDGENWTSTNSIISSKREAHVGALYKNGVWACEDGNSGFFRYSEDDGETWIESPTSPGTPTTQFSLEGGYFVACFGYAPPCYSANGKDWIQINSNMSNVYGITYDGTQWIAITDYKHIYTNDDITNDNTWIEVIFQTAPICNTFYAITYNDGIYYAYGAAYLNGAWCNIVETSPDLLNWTHSDKIFPDNDGWSGGYSRFICNGNFVAIEINNSMWYTLDQGSTWSDEIATHGHSTLIGNELWDVYEGTIYTFNTISHSGNILENISYNKSEVDTLLNQRLRVIHGGNSINVELDGDAANITYLPSTAYEAPTPQTWSYDGTLLTDMQNKKSYINMGYDSDTGNYIWKEVQTGSSQPTYDAATKTIIF